MDLKTGLAGLAIPVVLWAFHKWGRPVMTDLLAKLGMPSDEITKIEDLTEEGLKLAVGVAVDRGLAAASKNPKIDAAQHALEHLTDNLAVGISQDDAKKLVDAALASKLK